MTTTQGVDLSVQCEVSPGLLARQLSFMLRRYLAEDLLNPRASRLVVQSHVVSMASAQQLV